MPAAEGTATGTGSRCNFGQSSWVGRIQQCLPSKTHHHHPKAVLQNGGSRPVLKSCFVRGGAVGQKVSPWVLCLVACVRCARRRCSPSHMGSGRGSERLGSRPGNDGRWPLAWSAEGRVRAMLTRLDWEPAVELIWGRLAGSVFLFLSPG